VSDQSEGSSGSGRGAPGGGFGSSGGGSPDAQGASSGPAVLVAMPRWAAPIVLGTERAAALAPTGVGDAVSGSAAHGARDGRDGAREMVDQASRLRAMMHAGASASATNGAPSLASTLTAETPQRDELRAGVEHPGWRAEAWARVGLAMPREQAELAPERVGPMVVVRHPPSSAPAHERAPSGAPVRASVSGVSGVASVSGAREVRRDVPTEKPRGSSGVGQRESAPSTRPIPVIAIASGKGGVGKTSLSVNLCAALGQRGVRSALLDADIGLANADLLCGVSCQARLDALLGPGAHTSAGDVDEPNAFGAFGPLGAGAVRLGDIAVRAPGPFTLIPGVSGTSRFSELSAAQRQRLCEALGEVGELADVLVVDLGAGIGPTVTSLMRAADLALVVCTPEPTSIADAYALVKCLHLSGKGLGMGAGGVGGAVGLGGGPDAMPRVGLVVNQALDEREARAVHARMNSVTERFLCCSLTMEGWVAQDRRVGQAVRARTPLVVGDPLAPASVGIVRLATRLSARFALRRGGQDARGPIGAMFGGETRSSHAEGEGHARGGSLASWIRALVAGR
jgi:flagellar biosynthesis protein FlhG